MKIIIRIRIVGEMEDKQDKRLVSNNMGLEGDFDFFETFSE